jgi:hypothetical protein
MCCGCGKYPEPLSSSFDIMLASADVKEIAIADLPIIDYLKLSKFKDLKVIHFYKQGRVCGTDEKLHALTNLLFSQLEGVDLLKSSAVSDSGIEYLMNFKSLQWLQLEGTSITDKSLEILAKRSNIFGLNVAFSHSTVVGLKSLSDLHSLKELTFSTENDVTATVCEVFENCRQLEHVEIIDKKKMLNQSLIQDCAKRLGIHVFFREKGALER